METQVFYGLPHNDAYGDLWMTAPVMIDIIEDSEIYGHIDFFYIEHQAKESRSSPYHVQACKGDTGIITIIHALLNFYNYYIIPVRRIYDNHGGFAIL